MNKEENKLSTAEEWYDDGRPEYCILWGFALTAFYTTIALIIHLCKVLF